VVLVAARRALLLGRRVAERALELHTAGGVVDPSAQWRYHTLVKKSADHRSTQTSNPRDWVCLYRDASCHVLQSLLPDMKYG
jgi:hypothetical protein